MRLSLDAEPEAMARQLGCAGRHRARRMTRRLAPELVLLEHRELLSTFDVTSTADDGTTGTLRWAIEQANAASSPTTIDFRLASTPATITLTQGQLEFSNSADSTTIDGPGASLLSISGNNASRVFEVDKGVAASLSGLTITGGSTTGSGGGLYNYGSVTLTGCTISGNSAGSATSGGIGGGLMNAGAVTLSGCTISGNSATSPMHSKRGGVAGLASSGTATLIDCTISGNSTSSGAGGLWSNGTVNLTECAISGNSSGLSNGGTATLTGCTISDNSGAGIASGNGYQAASLTLTDCTISGNSGGGLGNFGTATVADCTINGNSAPYRAGGVDNFGTASLTACTISGNSAPVGGGVYNYQGVNPYSGHVYAGTVTLNDTIVAGNTDGQGTASDIGGNATSILSGSYNLIGTGGSGGLTNGTDGNIVLTSLANLDLGPLADNGGPTETMALLPGSAAIRAGTTADYPGTSTPISTDQRGRPLDSAPDIGAYQTQASHLINLSFTNLSSPTIDYGTASVKVSGTLASGGQAPPATESVQVTLDGVTHSAPIGNGGAFSITFDSSTLGVSASPYTIGYSYAGDGNYAPTSTTRTLMVNKATAILKAIEAGGASPATRSARPRQSPASMGSLRPVLKVSPQRSSTMPGARRAGHRSPVRQARPAPTR